MATTYRSIFDVSELKSEFSNVGINHTFIPIIWKHVLQNPNCKWSEIQSLPSAAYPLLNSKFVPLSTTLDSVADSNDGVTSKLLIKLKNGAFVEAVIMRYDTRLGTLGGKPRPGGPRSTLCVSSQVGCKMGCKFCATGTMGFKSNLSTGEIVEQLVHASRISSIRNIVFMYWHSLQPQWLTQHLKFQSHEPWHKKMLEDFLDYWTSFVKTFSVTITVKGMGEPLNNYSSLVEAVRIMMGSPFQLSPRKITVSTVGIIHAINKLQHDLPNINLAVSLHAPLQEIRCQIMPAARAFPLAKLMDSLHSYQKNSQQKIFIEYIMLDAVNDEEEHAHKLGNLLLTMDVVVNLIPFNPIGSTSQFKTSSETKVQNFQQILRGTYNIRTTVRKEMGQDISGACGQLVVNLSDKKPTGVLPDIEDLHL